MAKSKKIIKKKKLKKILPKKKSLKKEKKIIKTQVKKEEASNTAPLRLTKSAYTQEEKIEIKKIKKQPTEKRLYEIKDFVVYPKHGVGKIVSVEKATIGQIDIQFYKIFIEKEKLTLTVPINQQSNLRPISTINQINKCVSILKTKPKIKRTMWSRRAQEYEQKINSGDLITIAEVVRDLHRNDEQREQSYSERQLYEAALDRLTREVAAVDDGDEVAAARKVDSVLVSRAA